MLDSSDTIDGSGICALCGGSLLGERWAQLAGGSLDVFCSEACLGGARSARRAKRLTVSLLWARRLTIAGAFAAACLVPHQWTVERAPSVASSPTGPMTGPEPLPSGWFGPEWPPTETSMLAALGRDAWLHPLAGPARRMPRADSRVFGAVRPGNRAWECRNGHCGVDLGGEIWGEHVRAAHDGVVEHVQRAANPEHGGRYVRISHHGGTVFTQYFHLAAITRGLERGTLVKGGDVVGLLGDSGVRDSAPHLHFSVSIKLSPERYEKYIDPEPLIALWPLRVPLEGTEVGLVTITAPPGVPLGSMPLLSARARAAKAGKQKGKKSADGTAAPAPEEAAESGGEAGGETATPESEAPSDD